MVQDSLISALRSTGEYRSVSAIGSNLRGEYILRGRLNALDEVDKPKLPRAFQSNWSFSIPEPALTVWTDSYSHDEPVTGKTVPDVVEALDRNVRTGVATVDRKFGPILRGTSTSAPASTVPSSPLLGASAS